METTKNNNRKNVSVNLEKITNTDLLNINLDEVNVYDLIAKNSSLKVPLSKLKDKKESIYKVDAKKENETDKNFRTRIRKQRNFYLDNVLSKVETKDKKQIDEAIKDFIS